MTTPSSHDPHPSPGEEPPPDAGEHGLVHELRQEVGHLGHKVEEAVEHVLKPRVRFIRGGAPALLEAPWIQIRYSPLQWLHRDRRVIDVVVESPVIRVIKGDDGHLKLPVWRASGSPTRGSTALDVNLTLHH